MAIINLLTIHWGMCYGAVMQTYATCRLLEEQGHQVTVINLIHPKLRHKYLRIKSYKYIVREFQFWRFKKKYFSHLTKKAYSIDKINLPPADYTVVGSDQVWNLDITRAFGESFFLDFVPMSQKRIALSSSFGKDQWEESSEKTKIISQLLNSFSAISVRESSGVQLLKNAFGLDAINLVDPTLAYGRFGSFVSEKSPRAEVFVFFLSSDKSHYSIASKISTYFQTPLHHSSLIDIMFRSSPQQWLTNIYRSKIIVTDSFHGTALSILFHKNFFVLCANEKKFTRIQSLLRLLDLEDRFIRSEEDLNNRIEVLSTPIDYKKVDELLQKESSAFKSFISSNIQ